MSMSASTATELNQRVEAFRRLLLDTWNYLPSWMHAADDDGQALRDWLEANWEMLVSCPLNQTLGSQESWVDVKRRSVQHYGEGGVRNAPSKRAFDTDAWTTHEIVLNNGHQLYAFGSVSAGQFHQRPPFDHVMGIGAHGERVCIPVERARYSLVFTPRFQKLVDEASVVPPSPPPPTRGEILKGIGIALMILGVAAVVGGIAWFIGGYLLGKLSWVTTLFAVFFFGQALVGGCDVDPPVMFVMLFAAAWLSLSALGIATIGQVFPAAITGFLVGWLSGKLFNIFAN